MKSSQCEYGINPEFLPPECLWQAIEALLPLEPPKPKGGRRRKPDRQMFFSIFYVLRTGIQWKALPRLLGAPSTVHDRFQNWVRVGVFHTLWELRLLQCYLEGQLDFTWQSIDGCMTKAPLAGQETGPNPTDRGKSGTKRHLLTEAKGLPIGLVVSGAHAHDKTKVEDVLQSMPLLPLLPCEENPQHFCADKGYDFEDIRKLVAHYGRSSRRKASTRASNSSQLSLQCSPWRK